VEIWKKYRPKDLGEVFGQDDSAALLRKWLKDKSVPHAALFTGPSGCGKTTMARILARGLGVKDLGLSEVNCSTVEALEKVRDIEANYDRQLLYGGPSVWIMDEFQSLSRAPSAQQGMLPILEAECDHAYFFLCTTDPAKIIRAVRGRCARVDLCPLKHPVLAELVAKVAKAEGIALRPGVAQRIASTADGSAREALSLLEKASAFPEKDKQLAAVQKPETEATAFQLAQALMPFKGRPVWSRISELLESLSDEPAENVRRMLLANARATLLKGGALAARASLVIQELRDPLYSGGVSDHAVLAACCWDVCNPGGD
jgi:DNA polymerase III subunit gamma/tau